MQGSRLAPPGDNGSRKQREANFPVVNYRQRRRVTTRRCVPATRLTPRGRHSQTVTPQDHVTMEVQARILHTSTGRSNRPFRSRHGTSTYGQINSSIRISRGCLSVQL